MQCSTCVQRWAVRNSNLEIELGALHALHQCGELAAHLVGAQALAPAMAGEHPLEAVAREACERLGQLLPRVPARVAKRGEPAALPPPRAGGAGGGGRG